MYRVHNVSVYTQKDSEQFFASDCGLLTPWSHIGVSTLQIHSFSSPLHLPSPLLLSSSFKTIFSNLFEIYFPGSDYQEKS